MLKVIYQHSAVLLAILVLATSSVASGNSDTVASDPKTIEDAKTALENARSALESAQESLEAAQTKNEVDVKPTPKPKTKAKKKGNPGKLYKWVDEQGNVSYQDSPPPKNVKVLDSDVLKDLKSNQGKVKELKRSNAADPVLDGSQPVMVYTADNCKPCQSVVLYLTQKEVPFIERDIRDDRHARDRLAKQSKQISVPSLFIGAEIVQGSSKSQISAALRKAGYLK